MRIPNYSLTSGILFHLGFLILSAMLLINVVMIKFAENELLTARIESGRTLIHILNKKIMVRLVSGEEDPQGSASEPDFSEEIRNILLLGGFSRMSSIDQNGREVLSTGYLQEEKSQVLLNNRDAMTSGNTTHRFYGTIWGVIGLARKQLHVSAPVRSNGRTAGAVTIIADLEPLYSTLRKSEKHALIYIALNTVILVLVGIYLLSRSVVRPIKRLISTTEKFEAEEPFPHLKADSRNEIRQLSHSLTRMLKRLEENKKELREHIATLEKANREIIKAQNETVRSEKLASVGRLATGLAHEIGNPMGIILGYLEMAGGDDLTPEERRDFLQRIELEITRINRIIRQLLDLSRPTEGEFIEAHVHELLKELDDMMKPQPMIEHLKIVYELRAETDRVYSIPDQLKQVFLNIIMNAADAVKEPTGVDDGTAPNMLTIRSRNTGGMIQLSFTDTGPGIPDETISRVFDPFYTTKDPGEGTGLGLSVCHRIMEVLGGGIRIQSEEGKGATIIVDIPLYSENNSLSEMHSQRDSKEKQ